MKQGIAAVLIVGALLSTGGSTLAAGKLGGASGMDVVGQSRPVYAGKLGGAGGMDVVGRVDPLLVGSSLDAVDAEIARIDVLSGRLTTSGDAE